MANTEVERHTGVDVEDVPSADWGWSKENRKLIHIGGLLSAAFMLLMLRGNHVGHIEDATSTLVVGHEDLAAWLR